MSFLLIAHAHLFRHNWLYLVYFLPEIWEEDKQIEVPFYLMPFFYTGKYYVIDGKLVFDMIFFAVSILAFWISVFVYARMCAVMQSENSGELCNCHWLENSTLNNWTKISYRSLSLLSKLVVTMARDGMCYHS